jgi:hypothetical protein
LLVVMVALGCIGTAGSASAERSVRSQKPSPPVTVHLESVLVPGGYQVKLVAVPTRAVPAIELSLAGKRIGFAATAAGQRRELVMRVPVGAGAGVDVIGSASIGGRNKAAVLRVGVARLEAPKRTVIRRLPDGREVAEVRP